MTEILQVNGLPEHLSSYFEDINPTDRLSPRNGRERSQDGELDVSDLLGIERRALEQGITPAWALGILAAEQFRDDLTFTPEIKAAYLAVQEKLEGHAGEVALVFVNRPPKDSNYEGVDCYVGIIPEKIIFKSEPSYDSIVMPGEIGFHLVRDIDGQMAHLSGTGTRGELPLNFDVDRFDGFNIITGRTFRSREGNSPEGTEAMLLNEHEIVPALLEKCSPAMASEIIIQLATALMSQSPEKVKTLFGNIPEIAAHIDERRDTVQAYKEFFEDVQRQNESYLTSGGTIDQLTANFNALRAKYDNALSTLSAQHETLKSSIAMQQIMYERTRTWPYIDFDGHGVAGNLRLAQQDLEQENQEMASRVMRADAILEVTALLCTQKEQS